MNTPVRTCLALALCRALCWHHRETEIKRIRSPALEGFNLVSSTNRHPTQSDKRCDVELDTGGSERTQEGLCSCG